jgi:hypothetical protein
MNNPSLEELMGPKPTIVRTDEDALHIEWAVDDGNMTSRIGLAMDDVNYRESTLVVIAGKKEDSPMKPLIFGAVLPEELWVWVEEKLALTWHRGDPAYKGDYAVQRLNGGRGVARWNGKKWIIDGTTAIDVEYWIQLPELQ